MENTKRNLDEEAFLRSSENNRVKDIGWELQNHILVDSNGVEYFLAVEDYLRLFLNEVEDKTHRESIKCVESCKDWHRAIVLDIKLSDDRQKVFVTFYEEPHIQYEFVLIKELLSLSDNKEASSDYHRSLLCNIGSTPKLKTISSEVEKEFFELFRKKILLLRVFQIMEEALTTNILSKPFTKEVSKGFDVEVSSYDGADEYELKLILFGINVMNIVGNVDTLVLIADLNFFDSDKPSSIDRLFELCYDTLLQLFMEDTLASNLDDVDFGAFETKILEIIKENSN